MKCKTKMEAFWVMSTMRDYMDHMPDEFSASDFSFRALKGRPGSTGFIQLSLMKLSVLTHFMETILPKFGNEQFKDVVKCELTEHKTFREKCGSAAHAADLSWLAVRNTCHDVCGVCRGSLAARACVPLT